MIDPSTTPGCAACDESLSKDVRIDDWSAMMARAQAGDQAAYAALLEAITPYLRSLATAHCRRREDVEDAVQDILLTVHEIRHTYDPRRPVGPWLAAIARRRIADHLRQRYRRTIREAELAPRPETFWRDEANYHEKEGDARSLREAVAKLPSAQRRAIEMTKLREMSLKEASRESGMSVAALKVATYRGIKALQAVLKARSKAI